MFGIAAAQKIESAAAVRRAVGVAHHDGGDGLERRAQLFGHNLPVGRKRGALAEIALAGANQNRVVGMNFNPRAGQRGVERVLGSGGSWRLLFDTAADDAEADEQSAARFYQLTARQSGAENIDWFFVRIAIAYLLFAMIVAARCTASMMAV